MGKDRLPDTKLKLVKKIWDKHGVEVEVQS